ncbi:uncharacterized protein LOC141620062 [Silene latifolia]|uniref:uncharacterized protein LOC141620062 n=1 Tax=Silene latifolia TaxID=37657 RepID=UPI003D76DEC5
MKIVQKYVIDLLIQKYELFTLEPNESLDSMSARFSSIINELKNLGRKFESEDIARKVIPSLSCSSGSCYNNGEAAVSEPAVEEEAIKSGDWTLVKGKHSSSSKDTESASCHAKELLQFTIEDVASEVAYWERVKAVPIWLRLCGLPLKFWSKVCLEKLSGLLGKFVKRDAATEDKTRLGYARLLVEVEIGQEFPDKLFFKDEKGAEVSILVEYEWKPTVSGSCWGIGHTREICKKKSVPIPGPKSTVAPGPNPPVNVWRPVRKSGVMPAPGQRVFYTWNNKLEPQSMAFSWIDRFLINSDWMDLYPNSYAHFLSEGLFDHNPCTVVQQAWTRPIIATLMYKLVQKLKNLKQPLRELNRNKFSDVEKAVGVSKALLESIQIQMNSNPTDESIISAEKEAADSYKHTTPNLHSFLSQKAKVDWISNGDENTRFFHNHIRSRQIHNRVMRNLVTEEHKKILLVDVIDEEIKECLFSIPATKSPALMLLRQLNTTTLTLIPKIENPSSVLEFRPIACCNTLYKCLSKVLCKRPSKVLPDIVSDSQGGFVKGRNIVENVLICQDLVRLYNRKAASPRCLVTIDLKKAYDSIEWKFLEQMLYALKFPQKIIDLIMVCVSTLGYSLSVNGGFFGFFHGKRGLRQGDPLSPLLFTLCMEYLSRILKIAALQDSFRFHPMCSHLKLNHLLFADNLLMFRKGTESFILWILKSFATFSAASCLNMNKSKSEIYFNGTAASTVTNILQVSGFTRGTLPFKYLGIPISSKNLTKNEGMKLLDKLVARIRGWGARHLSYAGRLTLVSLVLSTLHTYWANIFLIPNGIMNKVNAICRNFLWSGKSEYGKPPTVSWDTCCAPKSEVGLGLEVAKEWNKALLGKYAWWLASKKDHIWVKWVNHVYMKGKEWNDYSPFPDRSWSWRKISQIMALFSQAYTNNKWMNTNVEYTVRAGYDWLRQSKPMVPWTHLCWSRLNIPKTSFIFWAAQHKRLLTKDRLV